jgi:uncharacterized protein (DUF58 family)
MTAGVTAPPRTQPRDRAERLLRSPRGLRFTREGRVFVMVTLGVGAAAVNTGNNLLYLVLGLMLSLILLSGVLSDLVLYRVRALRGLPSRAYVGSPSLVEITLENEKTWLPSFSLEAEDQADDAPTDRRCYFLKVEASGSQRASYRREPTRRGVVRFRRVRLTTRYPFGLFDKWRILPLEDELLVFPRIDLPSLGSTARSEGAEASASAVPGSGVEPAGVREYRPGDEARSLHARRSAALGRLVVREREREAARLFVVAIDNARPDGVAGWAEGFERAISRVAGLVVDAHRNGRTVEVVARGSRSPRVPPSASIDGALAFLALLAAVPADASSLPNHAIDVLVAVTPVLDAPEPGA